ncbi:MAG: hypothetical protein ACKV22_14515 [Bryobacteraceae bacterium]
MRNGILASVAIISLLAPACKQMRTLAADTPAESQSQSGQSVLHGLFSAEKPAQPLELAEGTAVRIRTTTVLSTRSASPGERFEATLAEPLVDGGSVIAPKGSRVIGRVVDSNPGGRIKGVARISIRLTELQITNGRSVDLETSTITRVARATRRRDGMKVGIGSGIGAAIGAIAGGGAGAAIGAAAGAGAGGGMVLLTRGAPAVIPSESLLTFTLRQPVAVARL